MNAVAPFGSILFDRPSDRDEHDDPSMFGDLNLDQVFGAVAASREEYELMPFFRCPLRDVRAVEYRHQVQRDLEDEAVPPGEPLPTSYGEDLYRQVFGTADQPART